MTFEQRMEQGGPFFWLVALLFGIDAYLALWAVMALTNEMGIT